MQRVETRPAGENAVYTVLALAVLALAVVPVGAAVFVLGFVYGDSPCVMCWEQRIGMALVALIGLFILRFGARPISVGQGFSLAASINNSRRATAPNAWPSRTGRSSAAR